MSSCLFSKWGDVSAVCLILILRSHAIRNLGKNNKARFKGSSWPSICRVPDEIRDHNGIIQKLFVSSFLPEVSCAWVACHGAMPNLGKQAWLYVLKFDPAQPSVPPWLVCCKVACKGLPT